MSRSLGMPSTTCAQGVNSKTFTPPPSDPFLSVPEVYDWHAEHSKDHPYFIYFDETTNAKVTVLWKDAVQAVYRIANSVSRSLGARKDAATKPLVGLYSSSGSLIYMLAQIGIMRAGVPVFLISNRASPVALRHLILKSRVTHILMNEDDEELKAKLQSVREDPEVDITVSDIPSWDELLRAKSPVEKPPTEKYDPDSLCIVLHSSGSTALPELNPWTHRMVHPALWQPWYGAQDLCGQVLSSPSIPMAGAAGVMQSLYAASSGLINSGFKPASPPTLPNLENVWKSMVDTGSTYGFVLQPVLAVWAQNLDRVKVLAGLEGVMFGGGPLPKAIGDGLVEKGVNLFTLFGSSEGGLLNQVFPRKMGLDWEYFSFYCTVNPGFRQETDDGIVELMLKSCPTHKPTRTNGEFENVPAYASGDLLQPHPTIPGLWKFYCRTADQETIGLGQKINAAAFERLLMTDPLIAGAVLVGHNAGASIALIAIIEPVGSYAEQADLTDPGAVSTYKDLIWPTFERYNSTAPSVAKIVKEKVIIASRAKPFSYGEKGMPRRKEAIAKYKGEILSLTS